MLAVNVTAGSAQFYCDLREALAACLATASIPACPVREFLQAVDSAGTLAAAAPLAHAAEPQPSAFASGR